MNFLFVLAGLLIIAVLLARPIGYSLTELRPGQVEGFAGLWRADEAPGLLNYDSFDQWGPTINFKRKQVQTGGTIGIYPAIPLANSCTECSNFSPSSQGGVCTKCSQGVLNRSDLDQPIYVSARAAGWPSATREII